jgi:hypothetical protein
MEEGAGEDGMAGEASVGRGEAPMVGSGVKIGVGRSGVCVEPARWGRQDTSAVAKRPRIAARLMIIT